MYWIIGWIVFWILFYINEGLHDVAFIKEIKTLKVYCFSSVPKTFATHYAKQWHARDALEKLAVKIVMVLLIGVITSDFLLIVWLFCISVFIRWFVHDLVIGLGLDRGWNYIGTGPTQSDVFLQTMKSWGINQYIIKLVPLAWFIFLAIKQVLA